MSEAQGKKLEIRIALIYNKCLQLQSIYTFRSCRDYFLKEMLGDLYAEDSSKYLHLCFFLAAKPKYVFLAAEPK